MEEDSNSTAIDDDDDLDVDDDSFFFDTLDDFPFYDSLPNFEPDTSSISQSSSTSGDLSPIESKTSPDFSSQSGLRRRRSFSLQNNIPTEPNPDSPVSSDITTASTSIPRERKYRFSRNLKESEKLIEKSSSFKAGLKDETHESSVVTATANEERIDDELNSADSLDNSFSILFYLAGLVVKAIAFQINLLVSFVKFPIWFLYSSYMFVTDPFRVVRHGKAYLIRILCRILAVYRDRVTSIVWKWAKENQSTWKLALRCCWGLLWSAYVCFILAGLFVSAFVVSGIIMTFVVEEPLQMKEGLNFDYTKDSPAAFIPIVSCPRSSCVDCSEKTEIENIGGARVVPPNHKLQATVSLTLPESDYNRNLGIFQVRVDFLSANGKSLASLRQPCMLQFKSQAIRLLLTFFKMAPLAAGYLSETQTLNIKFRGFTERDMPTSCLRVVMEQRAEYQAGAGIPEVYEAYLNLESELPLLKRILWSWKRTIFVWTSLVMFTMELLFTLLCCRPILVPRVRRSGGSLDNNNNSNNNAPQSVRPAQTQR